MLIRELITKLGFQVDDAGMKKFESGIASMKAKAESLATSFKDIGQKMTIALTLPILAAGAYVLKTGSEFEQLQMAFETMLGSAKKGSEFVDKLFDFAKRTPFNVQDVADGAKRLMAYGVAADDTLDVLQNLGDIAALAGREKLPFLITAFGQVKAATVLTGQELRQFTENSVPLIAELAKMTGHSEAEISSSTKNIGISYDTVRKAIKNLTSQGGLYFKGMEKQAQTVAGEFSNLEDQISYEAKKIEEILRPYTLKLIKFASDLVEKFSKLSPETKKWIVIILGIVAALGPMLFILGQIGIAVAGLAESWELLLPAIVIIGAIAAALGVLWLLYDDFAGYLEGRDNLLGPVWEKMLETINWMIDKWNSMMRFFQDTLLVFKVDGGALLDKIKEKFTSSFDNTAMESFAKALGQIWDWLVRINDYLGVTDKIKWALSEISGIGNFNRSVDAIQNRANEIDPNRSIRGGTPYYVSPFNIPGPVDKFVGPVNKKNDIRLNQAINIKVESSAKPEDIADAVKEGTRKLLGEQSNIISAAVEGGQLN